MAFEHYVSQDGRRLRMGYTTGTSAALAAAGAAEGLLCGRIPETLSLMTPKGILVEVRPEVRRVVRGNRDVHFSGGRERDEDFTNVQESSLRCAEPADRETGPGQECGCGSDFTIVQESSLRCEELEDRETGLGQYDGQGSVCEKREECGPDYALCGVLKDVGDDRDVTDKLLILARAQYEDSLDPSDDRIIIEGGEGIGRVTLPGLDQKVGEAAINRVPRRMIREAVLKICEREGYEGKIRITISAPGGEEAAKKTLNSKLGIVGGISIIGTNGIVEPMSLKAWSDSVRLQIRQTCAISGGHCKGLILTPGNYGMDHLREHGYDRLGVPTVVCSNFIGEAIDEAAGCGAESLLLVGHAGKLVKLAAGIMNTHSSEADGRMEIFTAHAAIAGASRETCRRLMDCVTTDACAAILKEDGLFETVMGNILRKAQSALEHRAGEIPIGLIMFSLEYGELGRTEQADRILKKWIADRDDAGGPDPEKMDRGS